MHSFTNVGRSWVKTKQHQGSAKLFSAAVSGCEAAVMFDDMTCEPKDSVKLLLDTELELCGRLLDVDERNFHCWNHRMHVMGLMRSWQKDQPQPIDLGSLDLKLSTDLINRNFSNYSAWHLRTLLQQRAGTEAWHGVLFSPCSCCSFTICVPVSGATNGDRHQSGAGVGPGGNLH